MENWLILQNFYNGLTSTSRAHIDAAAGGAFFSLIVSGATTLIEKRVTNQGWSEDRLQTQRDGMHTIEETDMLAAKLDLLIKCLDKKGAPMVPSNRSTRIYHTRCAETLDTRGTTASKPMKTRVQEQRVLSIKRSKVESVAPTTSGR
jgi:hypothetical protein